MRKKYVYVYLDNERVTGSLKNDVLKNFGKENLDFLKFLAFFPGCSVSHKCFVRNYVFTIVVKCSGSLWL